VNFASHKVRPRCRAKTAWRQVLAAIAVASAWSSALRADPFVYVANIGSDDVTVIDVPSNAPLVSIPVGDDPDGVAVTPDGSAAWVTDFLSNAVSIIDTSTQSVSATIPVGAGPVGIALSPDGAAAYVANKGSSTVSVMRTQPPEVVANVAVGAGPNGVAVSPDGQRVYVTNSFTQTPGIVSVIDTRTNEVIASIAVNRSPGRVAFAPDGAVAYVTNFRSWNVSVIDTATSQVVDDAVVFGRPSNVVISPNNTRAYVTTLAGRVQVYDTTDQATVESIDAGQLPSGDSPQPYGVATTHDGRIAYVANYASNTVAAIDLASGQVVAEIPTGARPFAVAVSCVASGCTSPPITPRPTRTATPTLHPTGSPTPTPTLAPTQTPPPTPTLRSTGPPVVISARAVGVAVDARIALEVSLDTAGHVVAGMQNDLAFDPSIVTLDSVRDCVVNPAIADTAAGCDDGDVSLACKTLARSLAGCDPDSVPGSCRLRAILFNTGANVGNPIPNGLLYTCSFRIVDPSRLPTTVVVQNAVASSPLGERLDAIGRDATIPQTASGRVDAAAPAAAGSGGCAIAPLPSRMSRWLWLSAAVLLWRRRRAVADTRDHETRRRSGQ
jgi:YVTN family beta-propeller protein